MTGETLFVGVTENYGDAKSIKAEQVVTVKYSGINAYGKLIQPVFLRARHDATWEDLLEMNKIPASS
jgi:tRNA splicing ligase